MSDESENVRFSPNASIDKAMKKLLKECDGPIAPEEESQMKVKVEVLKAAMTWEKLKHNIRDKDEEGTQWGNGDEPR